MTGDGDFLSELEESARDLLGKMAGGRRLQELKGKLAEIERRGRGGSADAEVITAVPLTAAERAVIEERLRDRHGEELPIAYHVDPAILGGVVVRVGDRMVDGSVASRLGQLREVLVGASTAGGSSS